MKDEKRILYNYNIDQKGYKWSDKTKLELLGNNSLPEYITRNFKKYEDWLE